LTAPARAPASTLRLVSYNLRFGGRGREDLLLEVLRPVAPDLVVLQEATDPTVVAALARGLGMREIAARPGHSVGVISRLPIGAHAWRRPPGNRHAFLAFAVGGFQVYGVHLRAVFSRWAEQGRTAELRRLLAAIGERPTEPHVLVGDFNSLAPDEFIDIRLMPGWLQLLAWLNGRRVQRDAIRHVLGAGYIDVFRCLHPLARGHTLPSVRPHVRLDYAFVPRGLEDRLAGCRVIEEPEAVRLASDHLPLLVELHSFD